MVRCVLRSVTALIPTFYLSTSITASAPIDFVRADAEVESCPRCAGSSGPRTKPANRIGHRAPVEGLTFQTRVTVLARVGWLCGAAGTTAALQWAEEQDRSGSLAQKGGCRGR